MTETVVFAGPCLGAEAPALTDGMELRRPARRGDVLAALADRPHTIVLLDGYFFHELSVAHKELLYALERGVRVIGAASMGALRAVEMAPFGMIGVGTIWRWYADGVIDGDDEVTVVHLPAEQGYRVVSVALVELRHALRETSGAGPLIDAVKRLGFAQRTPERVAALAREHLDEHAARALKARLDGFGLKRHDALEALALARTPVRPRETPPLPRTLFLDHWLEDHVRAPGGGDPGDATLAAAWNMVQLFHDAAPELVARLRLRFLAASAALRAGLEPDAQRVGDRADELSAALRRSGAALPPGEVVDEARVEALAELACRTFGSAEAAVDRVADDVGLDAGAGRAELERLLATQYGLLPSWHLARAFAGSPALRSALELAREAAEVERCFERWSGGARIARRDLVEVAAGLWGCAPHEVPARANARALQEAHGLSSGFREVVQRVAAAERLPRPINAYPQKKRALRAANLV